MFSEIISQIGHKGLCQVLLDSCSDQDLIEIANYCGVAGAKTMSDRSKALAMANSLSASSEPNTEIVYFLNTNNQDLIDRITQISDDQLLLEYSPQNTELDTAPGKILWALLHFEDRPACRQLLQTWVDFLETASLASQPADPAELFTPNEDRVIGSERQAVESLSKPSIGQISNAFNQLKALSDDPTPTASKLTLFQESIDSTISTPQPLQPASDDKQSGTPQFDSSQSDSPAEDQSMILAQLKEQQQHLVRIEDWLADLYHRIDTLEQNTLPTLNQELDRFSQRLTRIEQQLHSIETPAVPIPDETVEPEPESKAIEPVKGETPAPAEELTPDEQIPEPDLQPDSTSMAIEETQMVIESTGISESTEESQPLSDLQSKPTEEWKPIPGEPIDLEIPPEPLFQHETIVIVGGPEALVGDYRRLIESLGACFEHFQSVEEFSQRALEDLVDRAYLIIVLETTKMQPGVLRLIDIAHRLSRRLFLHHSSTPTSLYRFLLKLVEQGKV